MSVFFAGVLAVLAACVGYVFIARVPSISTFAILVMLVAATIFFILRFLQEQGMKLLDWLNSAVIAGEPTRLEKIRAVLTSISALCIYGLITLGIVMELVRHDWYLSWVGGKNGWSVFWAAVISIPASVVLIQTKKWPLKLFGVFVVFVGFLAPLALATVPGQMVAEKYRAIVEETADVDTADFKEFKLRADGTPTRVKLDRRAWRFELVGDKPTCLAAEFSEGWFGYPVRQIICTKGAKPLPDVWPFDGQRPGAIQPAFEMPVEKRTKVRFVSLMGEERMLRLKATP